MPARSTRPPAAPTTLLVVRHGRAVDHGAAGFSEFDRPLTGEGVERFLAVANELRRRGVGIDRILSSPLVRARQTAEILATVFGMEVGTADWFRPGADPPEVAAALDREAFARVALVGHEPDCGTLVGWLVDGPGSAGPGFRKGMVVGCRRDRSGPIRPGEWTVEFRLRAKDVAGGADRDD